MLERQDLEKIDGMLKDGLITRRIYNMLLGANDFNELSRIIVRLVTEKVVMMRYGDAPKLLTMVREAICSQYIMPFVEAGKGSGPVSRLLECWRGFLEVVEIPKEYDISVVLDMTTYRMINKFLNNSPRVSTSEIFNTVQPKIVNMFVNKNDNVPAEILSEYEMFPGLTWTYDSQEFIERSGGTIVICPEISSADENTVGLVCGLLEKGIFVITEGFKNLDLKTLIAVKDAIEKSPVQDGQGVLYQKGELYKKPFNPDISVGGGGGGHECSEHCEGIQMIPLGIGGNMSQEIMDIIKRRLAK